MLTALSDEVARRNKSLPGLFWVEGGKTRQVEMTFPQLQNMENQLLSLLSQADYDAIAGHARFLELPRGHILAQAGKEIEAVYF